MVNDTDSSAKRFCQVCGKRPPDVELVSARGVRPVIVDRIKQSNPEWSGDGFICGNDLNRFRYDYIRSLVEAEKGNVSGLEDRVLECISQNEILSTDVDKEFESQVTLAERLSDRLTQFGGSWTFIIIFMVILTVWIIVNSIALILKPFDPYPYIFLNLILSCMSAIQAPIIMMSQNRQDAKDRARATHDYQVNLKSELEVHQIHQKLDHLLSHQWDRLLEIQELQLELLKELQGLSTTPKNAD
jgi:uncharacterized membrane protein